MEILFATTALRTLCNDEAVALRTFAPVVLRHLRARLDDLSALACLGQMVKLPGRFRSLSRREHYVLNLADGMQLVLMPTTESLPPAKDGALDLDEVTSVTVISIGRDHA